MVLGKYVKLHEPNSVANYNLYKKLNKDHSLVCPCHISKLEVLEIVKVLAAKKVLILKRGNGELTCSYIKEAYNAIQ